VTVERLALKAERPELRMIVVLGVVADVERPAVERAGNLFDGETGRLTHLGLVSYGIRLVDFHSQRP
jgi:hypothetical protein